MHLVYIPVIHKLDQKSGKQISKISCYEFWKGKNSYRVLQNEFYNYIKGQGFDLERGQPSDRQHISTEKLKEITSYNQHKEQIKHYEKEIKGYKNMQDFYENYIDTMYDVTNILFNFPKDSMKNIIEMQIKERSKDKNIQAKKNEKQENK